MDIREFLHNSISEDEQTEYSYEVTVSQVQENPFYLPFGDKGVHHWELKIRPICRWLDDDGKPDSDWMDWDSSIEFKMTSYSKKPTIEEFSKHIYDELHAAFKAIGITEVNYLSHGEQQMFIDWDDCTDKVYAFMKALHKNYSKTEDYLRDYKHYLNRLYHDMKFAHALAFGQDYMFARSFSGNIEEKFFDFMNIEIGS